MLRVAWLLLAAVALGAVMTKPPITLTLAPERIHDSRIEYVQVPYPVYVSRPAAPKPRIAPPLKLHPDY